MLRMYELDTYGEKFYYGYVNNCFKAVFGKNENIDLLESLLEDAKRSKKISILGKIVKVYVPELPKDNIYNKRKVLDLLAETDTGEIILIEMNTSMYRGLRERNFLYASDIYSHQLKVGDDYKNINSVVQINFTSGLNDGIPKKEYAIANLENPNDLFVENFYIIEYNLDVIKEHDFKEYKYIKMLTYGKEELEKHKGDSIMAKYGEVLKEVNGTGEYRLLLSAEEDAEKTHNTLMNQAKEDGINQNKIEIAKNMLAEDSPVEFIAKVTRLSIEEINKLKNASYYN